MALSTAPAMGTPKWASKVSGVLVPITATVCPGATPARASAEASRRQRA
jgi:hypothetical protein